MKGYHSWRKKIHGLCYSQKAVKYYILHCRGSLWKECFCGVSDFPWSLCILRTNNCGEMVNLWKESDSRWLTGLLFLWSSSKHKSPCSRSLHRPFRRILIKVQTCTMKAQLEDRKIHSTFHRLSVGLGCLLETIFWTVLVDYQLLTPFCFLMWAFGKIIVTVTFALTKDNNDLTLFPV